ncbi:MULTISPECIES: class 1 fructose-bisphosphatase [unclassified Bradyrhizobium]|uniref:class 1 fructose-bisphosphatase n=1 Tax=unclassified Bradyrhizobium TaxID=2631580 RepID=UPI00247A8F6F|nr:MULTISPECIES: class 1 fructose-bisphosphatase [unclassified Bradyrhizobium]WGR69405.1 class 1 fructose-bisphosphatase [Bradyrhizobium sp. ISRA426]WGR81460.1 class 1 fructose-bisphosphatase [Bradyrhizobium sp. ISRA430]WGR84644.1 class 1 fructose-bisphosphatase [Bradyrhizobium sp. ISRA432]
MTGQLRLDDHLQRYSETAPHALSVAAAVDAIASASLEIADLASTGQLADASGLATGRNSDGDLQRDLDVQADAILRRCLGKLPIAALASEEMREPQLGDREGRICVAIDPLDGSSNIDINMTVGTIFSILPAPDDIALAFHQRGSAQLAAGFITYGPQTSLVLTLGEGVDIFTHDRKSGCFRLARTNVQIAESCEEFAINGSNRRHWDPPVRAFIDECLAGVEGPANHDFNMRWIGSLVAEAYRILTRGGVFLYPSDARPGYGDGRLRLTYEAHPMAFIVEQAGGSASTGRERILDLAARDLHQRVPLIMGSSNEVRRVEELHCDPLLVASVSAPLFARRGFFRL